MARDLSDLDAKLRTPVAASTSPVSHEVLASLSHHLSNSLAAVLANIQFAMQATEPGSEALEALTDAHHSAEELADIVDLIKEVNRG